MEIGDKAKFKDIPVGGYFASADYVFQSVRSGDVMQSFAPDCPVMKTYAHLSRKNNLMHDIGSLTIDYFNHDFIYLGKKEIADRFIEDIIKEENKK